MIGIKAAGAFESCNPPDYGAIATYVTENGLRGAAVWAFSNDGSNLTSSWYKQGCDEGYMALCTQLCARSPSPPPPPGGGCSAAEQQLCGAARESSVAACQACAVDHIAALAEAGCRDQDITQFCNRTVSPCETAEKALCGAARAVSKTQCDYSWSLGTKYTKQQQ